MYRNTSERFNEVIASNSRTFLAKMVASDGTEITDDFISLLYNGKTNANDVLGIGNAVSASVEVSMRKPVTEIALEDEEFQFFIGLTIERDEFFKPTQVEYVPLGFFTPLKPKYEDKVVSFVAYDRLWSKMNSGYFSELTYPADGKAVLAEISQMCGVEIDTSNLPDGTMIGMRTVIGESTFDDEGEEIQNITYEKPFHGYTYKEALGYVAQFYAKFVYCDRDGIVRLKWYDEEEPISVGRYYDDLETTESEFTVDAIQCTNSAGENLVSGEGFTTIAFENPVFTQEALDNVRRLIKDFSYLPSAFTFFGDIRLDLGDTVALADKYGDVRRIQIMDLTYDFDGGVITGIKSVPGVLLDSTGDNAVKGPTATALDRVYSELLLVKDVIGRTAKFDDLKATRINVKELEAKSITTDYLNANYADLGIVHIDDADIDVLAVRDGAISTAKIADGSIVDAKIGNVSASKLTAGTIDASDIDVVNLNASNITVGTLNGKYIGEGTVDLNKLDESVPIAITEAAIDGIQIGSRNLIRNSKTLIFDDYRFNTGSSSIVGIAIAGSAIVGSDEPQETVLALDESELDVATLSVSEEPIDYTDHTFVPGEILTADAMNQILDRIAKTERKIQTKSTSAWLQDTGYIPEYGTIIVFTDYMSQTDEYGITTYIPSIKIGDGLTNVIDLPFVSGSGVSDYILADKLKHTITIGDQVFDGTEDVVIPVYRGEYS